MSNEPATPLEAALDLFVYIPVGFALTVGEEIPKLAAKGRARLGGRIAAARMIGQFAVAQGRREVDRRMAGTNATPTTAPSRPAAPAARPPAGARPAAAARPATAAAADAAQPDPAAPVVSTAVPEAGPHGSPVPAGDAPDVAALAIPDYDSLSASQVVQRLAGLSQPELEAVRLYEAASRGRRTILARVTQLQAR